MTKLPEPTAIAICYDGTPYSLWHHGDGPLLDAEVQRQGGTVGKLFLYDKQAILDALEEVAKLCESQWSNVAEKLYGIECADTIRKLKEEYK